MVTMANLALLRWAHFGAILCLTLSRYIISSHSLTIPSSPLLILSSHNPSRLCEAVLKPAIAASQVQQPLLLSLSPLHRPGRDQTHNVGCSLVYRRWAPLDPPWRVNFGLVFSLVGHSVETWDGASSRDPKMRLQLALSRLMK